LARTLRALAWIGPLAATITLPTAAAALTPRQPSTTPPALAADAAAIEAELAGIAQQGLSLGLRTAPVTVVEYTDLVCSPCASAAATILTPLIDDYVRPGMVRIVIEPVARSQRSSEYAYGAYSAGMQGAGFADLMLAYARSTPRSDGPLDSPAALAGALGLNVARWRSNLFRPRWANYVEQAVAVAAVGNFTSFPAFTVRGQPGPGGRAPVAVLRAPVSLAALTAAIAEAQTR